MHKNTDRIKINRQTLFLVLAAVTFLGYLVLRMIPEKTVILRSETVFISEPARLYTFKDEDHTKITTSNPINITVQEGTSLSATDLISDNYRLRSKAFIEEKIDSVSFMIDNPSINTKWEVYEKIILTRDDINALTENLMTEEDENQRKILEKRINELKSYENMLRGATQFILTPLSEMYNIRYRYNTMLENDTLPLNMYNLNFAVFGYVYFNTDGYEDVMNLISLEGADSELFSYLESYKPEPEETKDNTYIIRSTARDRAIIAALVDKKTVIPSEDRAKNRKSDIINRYNTDQSGGYYSYLFDRIDLLINFPQISVKSTDGDILTGYLVDVIDAGDKKAAVIAFRSDIPRLEGMRIENGELQTESFRAFVLNKSSIVEKDGKTYIIRLRGGSAKEALEVTVDRYTDKTAILRASRNPTLTNKTEILLDGEDYDF
ncbi:MAG: hypothetical protein IKM61_07625 [Eubacteriaceae bacterium]|nr:hypothetical protein [Eubacteriaceae bacterium]